MIKNIYRYAKRIEALTKEKESLQNLVLFIVGVNLAGFTLVPFLILLTGDVFEYDTLINLGYGVVLVAFLAYLNKKTSKKEDKFVDGKISSFLISVYFTTILIIFLIKTVSLFGVPFLATITPYDIEMMQLYVWPALSYILWICQFYILYTAMDLETNSRM
jgi:hypothetical protein